ncbi:hypothetical protein [Ruegeria arenilitoris]|uniref:hypothetical protein n=1 Tax=Ruegeria arenilitoris TaxID=1173585 RepID=UPI00147BD8E9|nr:hypothetical protein [Ruegeria arenilitoris]
MRWARFALIAVFALGNGQMAFACGVCIEKHEETVADRILDADAVVIARESPERPRTYVPVAYLYGAEGGPAIPFLVDSSTRRRLERQPADGVLMLRTGEDWAHVGYANAAWRMTAARIVETGPDWQNAPDARFAFFEELLHAGDQYLRRLAIDELSRAEYGRIRQMTQPITGEVARQYLGDRSSIPWHPFFILMIGLSDRDEDHTYLRERITVAARVGGGPQLDALATALVEIDGTDGTDRLVKDWFNAPGRSRQEIRSVISALTTHAVHGDPGLKDPVLAALAELSGRRPDVAGSVATAFWQIGDFTHAEAITSAIKNLPKKQARRIDAAELFAVSSYAYQSRYSGKASFDPLVEN